MSGTYEAPPNKQNESTKAFFEPPMNTDEHRLTADKAKSYKGIIAFSFFMLLSVFIGVHRWLIVLFGGPGKQPGWAMYGDSERAKAFFEPPMNTDEHRLTADKAKSYKGIIAFSFFMLLSVFIGVHRWLIVLFGGPGKQPGWAMYGDSERAKAFFEPPMNTDEHRLTADKAKSYKGIIAFSFLMLLSVFIGVHRWLKILFSSAEILHSVRGRSAAQFASIGPILFPFRLDTHPGRSYVLLSLSSAVAVLVGASDVSVCA